MRAISTLFSFRTICSVVLLEISLTFHRRMVRENNLLAAIGIYEFVDE